MRISDWSSDVCSSDLVQAYRAEGAHEIGLVVNIEPKHAATDSGDDAAAVKREHAYMNEQYLHPALLGRYPPELKEIFGDAWPEFPPQDFDLIVQPLDFVGINYYTRSVNRASDSYPRTEEHTSELQPL